MSAGEARHVLRALLRAIDRNVTVVTGNKQWREFAIAEFRRQREPEEREQLLQQARDYAMLLETVREHKELLLSYNIGIAVDKRERDMNKRAAQLVGLKMPQPQEHG